MLIDFRKVVYPEAKFVKRFLAFTAGVHSSIVFHGLLINKWKSGWVTLQCFSRREVCGVQISPVV